jgi:hypothetical protein
MSALAEIGREDGGDDCAVAAVGHDPVDGAEVLFDVHRHAVPHAAIVRIGAEPHRRRRVVGECPRHDGDEGARIESRARDRAQHRLVTGDDDDASLKRGAHVDAQSAVTS